MKCDWAGFDEACYKDYNVGTWRITGDLGDDFTDYSAFNI